MGKNVYYNNADLLGKLPPQYYLNRRYHFGTIDISAIDGLWDIINNIDVSLGTITLYAQDISTSHVWYDTLLSSATPMPIDIGGYSAGTTVADVYGDNLREILDTLLFGGNINPTLTGPSATFAKNPDTSIYEVADTPTITFTTTFSRGSISPQFTSASPYRSGLPNYYDYTGTGLIDTASSSLTDVQAIGVTVVQGSQSWSAEVDYDAGVQPYNARGEAYSSPLAAGTVSAVPTLSIEGVYPLFATTVSITVLTKQTLVSMSASPAPTTSGMSLVPETGGNKQKFEIPNAWTAINPLTAIETYNTTSGQWEYEGGTTTTSLAKWTTSSVTETIQGNVINYTRYTYNGVDRSTISVRLVF